jgi:hypothetical protein
MNTVPGVRNRQRSVTSVYSGAFGVLVFANNQHQLITFTSFIRDASNQVMILNLADNQ